MIKLDIPYIIVLFFFFIQKGFCTDLGIYGTVWEIKEVNLKQLITEELQKVDLKKIELSYKSQAEHFGEHLKPNVLSSAEETKTFYIDPSVSLSKNIIINGKVIYKKDTLVNPLTIIRPTENMLFFDGDDKDQLNFALKAQKSEPYRLMLVMTKGDPIRLANKIHSPIYYATDGIISRFHIEKIPTLLGVGVDQHRYELAITTLASPYSIEVLKSCWNGCVKTKKRKQEKQKGINNDDL